MGDFSKSIQTECELQLTDARSLLQVLKDAEGTWVGGLYNKVKCVVHSRISDLRKQGYKIECKRFGLGDYRYRLLRTNEETNEQHRESTGQSR